MSALSENIKKYREAKGLKQSEVAEAVGKSANVVSNWERGDNQPDPETIRKLCKLFGIDANTIYGWDNSGQPKIDAKDLAERIAASLDIKEGLPIIIKMSKPEIEMLKIFLKGFNK